MKREDKQIRMKLREACEPEKTFEQFCGENNIEVQPQKRDTRKLLLKALLPCVASAAVILAIVLPITLRDTAPSTKPEEPPLYGNQKGNSQQIKMDELLADKNVVMYNRDGEYVYAYVAAIYSDDWKEILYYNIVDVFWVNDIQSESPDYQIEFDYKIKLYDYFVIDPLIEQYKNFENCCEHNSVKYYYDYSVNDFGQSLKIYFKSGAYDYFITGNIVEAKGDNVAEDFIKLMFK